jgi:hypothetical protein
VFFPEVFCSGRYMITFSKCILITTEKSINTVLCISTSFQNYMVHNNVSRLTVNTCAVARINNELLTALTSAATP